MARAEVRTLLPLDRFTRIVAYSPMLFSQVYIPGEDMQPASSCSDPVLQYTWQARAGGAPGREEIASAVQQAENMLRDWLHFSPLPQWVVDDYAQLPRSVPGAFGGLYAAQNRVLAKANEAYLIYGGIEAYNVIELDSPVTYTDTDNDGYDNLATVVVTTSVTDRDQFVVYYPGTQHDPAWEIRPIRVDIASGVATIMFDRHQAVKPELLEALTATGVNGLDDANFLTTVDVYQQYNDPSVMAKLQWMPSICCDDSGGYIAAQTAALTPLDNRNALVALTPGTWDAVTQRWNTSWPAWWTRPTSVRLWYRAGLRGDARNGRPSHDMNPDMERAITYLALSYLDRDWLTCEQVRNLQAHWREDLAVRVSSPAESTSYNISRALLDNPFGTTRAAIFAWRVVQQHAVGEAVLG